MPLTALATIKSWFITGAKPTQTQFANVFDSFRYAGDKININDLSSDLQAAINGIGASDNTLLAAGTASFVIPAGTLLEKIIFIDASNPSIGVGTTNGGTDVYPLIQMTTGVLVASGDMYFSADTTIYFTGITGNTIVKIYKDAYTESAVPVANAVTGTTLPAGTQSFAIAPGTLLQKIMFIDASNPLVSVGTAEGATDIYGALQLANGYGVASGDEYFAAATTIYFNGITGSTIIKIVKL